MSEEMNGDFRKWGYAEVTTVLAYLKETVRSNEERGAEGAVPVSNAYYAKLISELNLENTTPMQVQHKVHALKQKYIRCRIANRNAKDSLGNFDPKKCKYKCQHFNDLHEIYGHGIALEPTGHQALTVEKGEDLPTAGPCTVTAVPILPPHLKRRHSELEANPRKKSSAGTGNTSSCDEKIRILEIESDERVAKYKIEQECKYKLEIAKLKNENDDLRNRGNLLIAALALMRRPSRLSIPAVLDYAAESTE